ncbi:MAG: hypothetical protein IPJ81_08770 [Chitinophagaceae bacterium]|nr:hypothetical protein [Chitinophagaceae bacterium]
MYTEARKIHLIEALLKVSNEATLIELETVLKKAKPKKEKQEKTKRISIKQYNKEIDEALAEAKAGNYITQKEMEKLAAKW